MLTVDLTIEDLDISATQARKLKRKQRKNKNFQINAGSLYLKDIKPMTTNQKRVFKSYDEKNLLLHGLPGTGKTFISLYLALKDMMSNGVYRRVVIIRSVVPTREMGYLPGSAEQKMGVYEAPYTSIVSELFGRGDAYNILKNRDAIEFMTTSFIRGLTIDNSIIIVDEIQNMCWQELHSVITRVGNNSKIIFCGDIGQDDLTSERYHERSGIVDFMNILDDMKEFDCIEFEENDIVRSGLVKQYLLAYSRSLTMK